jgi:hypothetical protein
MQLERVAASGAMRSLTDRALQRCTAVGQQPAKPEIVRRFHDWLNCCRYKPSAKRDAFLVSKYDSQGITEVLRTVDVLLEPREFRCPPSTWHTRQPEAEQRLAGVAHIIHAGDIGRADVLVRRIAPVTAIRGNIDAGDLAKRYPILRWSDSASAHLCLA